MTLRYVSFKELADRTTLCRATIYNLIERGELPQPERLSPRRVGWPVDVIDAWLASRKVGVAQARQDALEAAVESRHAADPSACTFTPYVKRVYATLKLAADPSYDDLPEREQRPWRLLAHATVKLEAA